MRRNKFFAVSLLSLLRRPCRWVATAVVLILITSVNSANAQSRDRDNPTRVTSNQISGIFSTDSNGDNYHYTFVAGPGEIIITLSAEARSDNVISVSFELFDEDAKKLGGKIVQSYSRRTEQAVERINITRRQPMLLRIIVIASYGPGDTESRLGGAVSFGPDAPATTGAAAAAAAIRSPRDATSPSKDNVDNPECLPKKGILRVKMKDGSIRRIDLRQAEEITVEH